MITWYDMLLDLLIQAYGISSCEGYLFVPMYVQICVCKDEGDLRTRK